MLRIALLVIFLFNYSFALAQSSHAIGFKQIELVNSPKERPINVALWYPTSETNNVVSIAENVAFNGFLAIKNAQPDTNTLPLIVLSHGYGGSWRNLSWLAG